MAFCWLLFLKHKLVPNPAYPKETALFSNETPDMKPDVHSTCLDVLYTCEATNPKDMSFGLQSVLRHLARSSESTVDYTTSIEYIYTRLTVYLLEESNSLHLLTLAAQQRLPGHLPGSPISPKLSDQSAQIHLFCEASQLLVPKHPISSNTKTEMLYLFGVSTRIIEVYS